MIETDPNMKKGNILHRKACTDVKKEQMYIAYHDTDVNVRCQSQLINGNADDQ